MRRKTQYIVVHCSATKADADIGFDEINEWHKARKWNGCGYHAIIRRDGEVEFGRHFDAVGAHTIGYNSRSVAVCLVGGTGDDGAAENNFTAAQFASLAHVLSVLSQAYRDAEVCGHRDLSPDLDGDGVIQKHEWVKDCPSFDVQSWWELHRDRVGVLPT